MHDLGIWTANTFDYLEKSADLALPFAGEFGITDIAGVRRMVTEHHRLRSAGDELAETFRVADRIDVSRGLIAGGISRSSIKAVVAELPYVGFHAFWSAG